MRSIYQGATALVFALFSPGALASNASCWGHGTNDATRPDITCASLDKNFVMRLRFASIKQVRKMMDATGVLSESGTLQFLSNADYGNEWTGFINLKFDNNKAIIIFGNVDGPGGRPNDVQFLWNASTGEFCSDYPGSKNRC